MRRVFKINRALMPQELLDLVQRQLCHVEVAFSAIGIAVLEFVFGFAQEIRHARLRLTHV